MKKLVSPGVVVSLSSRSSGVALRASSLGRVFPAELTSFEAVPFWRAILTWRTMDGILWKYLYAPQASFEAGESLAIRLERGSAAAGSGPTGGLLFNGGVRAGLTEKVLA